jgi:thiamine-monophosphate kinase
VKLRELGEGVLIRKIRERFSSGAAVGIGDDAAVFDLPRGQSAVFCSDLVAENTHFLRDLHPPDAVAYKSIAASVSDIGAMGGTPLHFLISLALPGELDLTWFEGFFDGVARACDDFEISLLGGDSSSSAMIFVDVSMVGRIPAGKAVLRSGAKAGDHIYVTGALGASALGLERIKAGSDRDASIERHLYPAPRHKVGAAIATQAHAMIDVSDGFSTDLSHILAESKVSARIYKDRLPAAPGTVDRHVLHGGEEYELLIVGLDLPATVEGIPLTHVGEIVPSRLEHQAFLLDGISESVLRPTGWQHFS